MTSAVHADAASERILLPYACAVASGQVVLRPAQSTSYAILGRREQQPFTACLDEAGPDCRTLMVHDFELSCGGDRVRWATVAGAMEKLHASQPRLSADNSLSLILAARRVGSERLPWRNGGDLARLQLPPGFAPVGELGARFVLPSLQDATFVPPNAATASAIAPASAQPTELAAANKDTGTWMTVVNAPAASEPPVTARFGLSNTAMMALVLALLSSAGVGVLYRRRRWSSLDAAEASGGWIRSMAGASPVAALLSGFGRAYTGLGSNGILRGGRPARPAPLADEPETLEAEPVDGRFGRPMGAGRGFGAHAWRPPADTDQFARATDRVDANARANDGYGAAEGAFGRADFTAGGPLSGRASFGAMPSGAAAATGYATIELLLQKAAVHVANLPPMAPLAKILSGELTGLARRFQALQDAVDRGQSAAHQTDAILRRFVHELDRISRIAESAGAMPTERGGDMRGPQMMMPETPDEAFAVLGVNRDVTPAALKKIVDGLRMTWHPDHARDAQDRHVREDRIKQVNIAWDLITGRR